MVGEGVTVPVYCPEWSVKGVKRGSAHVFLARPELEALP